MADQEGRFESVEGVAEQLLVDVQTVRRWIKSGKLKAYRPGREYRILSSDLEEFLKTREVAPKAPAPLTFDFSGMRRSPEQRRRLFSFQREMLNDEARTLYQWSESIATEGGAMIIARAGRDLLGGLERLGALEELRILNGALDEGAITQEKLLPEDIEFRSLVSDIVLAMRKANEFIRGGHRNPVFDLEAFRGLSA